MKKILSICIISLIALVGCRNAPVYNPTNVGYQATDSAELAKVEKAIKAAGTDLGWIMKSVSPGKMQGNISVRGKHHASVLITYNTTSFSIQRVSTSNLKYNASNNTIHNNYNGWVQNLENSIQRNIALLS